MNNNDQHSGDDLVISNRGTRFDHDVSAGGSAAPSEEPSQPPTATTSQNTTPHDTPPSTPGVVRRSGSVGTVLKLNVRDSTWHLEKASRTKNRAKKRSSQAAFISKLIAQGRTPEFRFQVVLVFLFVCIVTLVILSHHLHAVKEQVNIAQRRARLVDARYLTLFNSRGNVLLNGELGVKIPSTVEAHECPPMHGEEEGFCFEWKYRAKLYVTITSSPSSDDVKCYNVLWNSKSSHNELLDCFALTRAFWFGMGEVDGITWPLANLSIDFQAFQTGNVNPLGSVVQPYWLSSRGVGIQADLEHPLMFMFNKTGQDTLCLASSQEILNYTICTGNEAKSVHQRFYPQTRDNQSRADIDAVVADNALQFIQLPILVPRRTRNYTFDEDVVREYSNKFVDHGFKGGFVLLSNWWQKELGDFEFDRAAFRNPLALVKSLKDKGSRVMLDVTPYIGLNSDNFKPTMEDDLLISAGDLDNKVPLLTKWNDSLCAVLNMANRRASNWFLDRLYALKLNYSIAGFVFKGGQARALPLYESESISHSPNAYMSQYLSVARQSSMHTGTPGEGNGFVTLAPQPSTWSALQSILPKVLTLGLLGYRIVNPGSVGGDTVPPGQKPDRELYFRWWQLAVFMPVLQFSVLPSEYVDDFELTKISRVLANFRNTRVVPAVNRSLQEEPGAPVVRPLWWLDPLDSNCYGVTQQFAVGNDLIVVAVVDPGRMTRRVYLPVGNWCEDQKLHNGETWIKVDTPLNKITYFYRTTDDKCK